MNERVVWFREAILSKLSNDELGKLEDMLVANESDAGDVGFANDLFLACHKEASRRMNEALLESAQALGNDIVRVLNRVVQKEISAGEGKRIIDRYLGALEGKPNQDLMGPPKDLCRKVLAEIEKLKAKEI